MSNFTLWRLHLRSKPKNGKTVQDIVDYCIDKDIAGIGWPVDSNPQNPEEYRAQVLLRYGKTNAGVMFAQKPQIDDLIWARSPNGTYYLGRIMSDWFYSNNPEHLELDIPSQRQCDWVRIGAEDGVPGKVIACFRPRVTFQPIRNTAMYDYSRYLYNKGSRKNYYHGALSPNIRNSATEFFGLISARDCEDIVAIYLQARYGYIFIPSTHNSDTIAYEFILKEKASGKKIVAQVKQGNVNLDNRLTKSADIVFLFSTEGVAEANGPNIRILEPDDLFSFVLSNQQIMPDRILYWLNQ